ncbi:hypothetical protein SAMN05444166_0307 [Singulisphaera sp. GP187]|uniref:hypothetical protein n=1 Tax=Singulisphaera sp. GP187 TaxID=1882752 RepID=UPI000928C8A8|nr:hypothetical protein [Singulisphaera sp. GP187]SIN70940.1 hypothetical protein SAMN05444166_0307 [Singulisphaera sp. GP187]
MSQVKAETYLPEPELILLGCRAWDALKPAVCPVCKNGIQRGDDASYCARCDSMSPKREAQILAARLSQRTRSERASAERDARLDLERLRNASPILTEAQRRRLWMGYSQSGIDSRNPDVANRAKAGRDWLIAIGQEPDWSIELDAKGRPKKAAADAH